MVCLSVLFVFFRVLSWPTLLPQAKKSVYIRAICGLPFCIFLVYSLHKVGQACEFVAKKPQSGPPWLNFTTETFVMDAFVKSSFHNGITSIEFFHPQSNSLPGRILDELAQAIHAAGNDEATKVVLIRSFGEKAFCAGASFDELAAIRSKEEGLKFFSGFAQVINAMRICPKLIIGRIHGKCVGGGVGLAAAVDYAIATDAAEVKLSELAVGIGPFVVGPAVERKAGHSPFSQLSIDATRWRSA